MAVEWIFSFWDGGPMPDYLKMCMRTWKIHKDIPEVVLLNYKSMFDWFDMTGRELELLKKLTLPQQADYVRVHVLRNHGGYWLDCDTIALTGKLPETDILGDNNLRINTIGYLHTKPHSHMYEFWAAYQDRMLPRAEEIVYEWNCMGNKFTDVYLSSHPDILIGDIKPCWPETYMVKDDIERGHKYKFFYFRDKYKLSDLGMQPDILMLHNSWTPHKYKIMSEDQFLKEDCTLSNILREALKDG